MEYVHLVGTEAVERAAREIVGAADTILRAATIIDEANTRQQLAFQEFAARMEAVALKLMEHDKE